MLQSIRDRSQGWFAGAVIAAVIAAFALWGIHSYLGVSGGGEPDVAAKVNKRIISQPELNASYERLRQQQQMQLGADFVIDPKAEMNLKKAALNQLIMGQVLSQAAYKEGYRITIGEVEGALLGIPAFQVDGRFSRQRFNEVLSGILYTEKTFLSDLQSTMLINQVRSGIVNSAFALPNDVSTAIRLINQKRDFGYMLIPAARFRNSTQIDDTTARNYYQQHQVDFMIPEQVSVEYLELSLPQIASGMHFTDAQLQQFYQNNISNYTTPERWHVAHILVKLPIAPNADQLAAAQAKADDLAKKINAGENFAALAEQNSDDRLSARDGGVLDWFSTGMIDPDFEKAVANLKQPGDVTAPVRTKYGFSIIKLLAVQKPEVQPFDKVRGQVSKAVAQQQAEQLFANESDKLSNLSYANPTSLDVPAKTLGLQVKTTDLFDRQGGKNELTAKRKIIDAAFSQEVLQGNNSDVVELDPDTLVVLRIKQHVPSSLRPFESVRAEVVQRLALQATQQKAQALGEQMVQQIKAGSSAQQLAQANQLRWQTVMDAARFGSQTPAMLLNMAFHMPRPAPQQAFTTAGYPLPNGDYAVLMLTGVHDGDVAKIPPNQQRIYSEELENGYGQLDYALYTHGLLEKAKIVINTPKS